MSENVEIAYGERGDQAVLLISAAEELGLDASVVRTTGSGFLVPAEVAKKAGLGEPEKPPAKKAAAKKSEAKE